MIKIKNNIIKELFHRYPHNPIISINDIPYIANSVFNAGAVKFNVERMVDDYFSVYESILTREKN